MLHQESSQKHKILPSHPWFRLSHPTLQAAEEKRKRSTQNSLKVTNLYSSPLLILQFTHPLRWQKGVCPATPQPRDHCTVEPSSLMPQLLHPSAAHCWISGDLGNNAQTKCSFLQTCKTKTSLYMWLDSASGTVTWTIPVPSYSIISIILPPT